MAHSLIFLVVLTFYIEAGAGIRRNTWSGREDGGKDAWTELQRRLRQNPLPRPKEKNSVDVCVGTANVRANTIIRTNASRVAGAVFIDTVTVNSERECIARCCHATDCNLAVVDSKLDPAKCFLFDCKHPTVCQFTRFAGYSSISLPRGSPSPPSSSSVSHKRRVNSPPPREPPTPPPLTPRPTPPSTTTMAPQEADLDSWRLLAGDDDDDDDDKEDYDDKGERRNEDVGEGEARVNPNMLEDVIKLFQYTKHSLPETSPTLSPLMTVVNTTTTTTTPSTPATSTAPRGSCASYFEVLCANGDGCVALNDVCDGFAQCNDASDENHDVCLALKGRGGTGGGGGGYGGSGEKPTSVSNDRATTNDISAVGQGRAPSSPSALHRHSSPGRRTFPVLTSSPSPSSSSSTSSRSRNSSRSKTNPGLVADLNVMTRQLEAMTMRTATAMTTAATTPPVPLRLDGNGSEPDSSSATSRAALGSAIQKGNLPSEAFHHPLLPNSSSPPPPPASTPTTTTTITSSTKANSRVSLQSFEDPHTTDSRWTEGLSRRAFVRRNASVALGCGLLLFFGFVLFASVKLKPLWLPRLRGRGRRGNAMNREADYLINGMYL